MSAFSVAIATSRALVPAGRDGVRDLPLLRLWQGIEQRLAGRPHKVVQLAPCTEAEADPALAVRFGRVAGAILGGGVVVLREGPADDEAQVTFGPLPGGPLAGRGGALRALDPVVLAEYWRHLRRRADLVIIDGPPVLASPVALAMAPTVDGVVLVVEAEKTRAAVAAAARDALAASRANVLGVVLAGRRYPVPKALYDRL
jgi:hypothetical protein